jgi:hypothetical protein
VVHPVISDEQGLPMVPVFNSQNIGGLTLDALMSQAGGTLNLITVMAQLSKQ